MRYSEVFEGLQKLTNEKPTQEKIATAIGVGQTAIAGRARRNTEFSDDEIKMLEKSFNVIFPSPDGDKVQIDYYPDVLVSCGNGIYSLGETKEKMTVLVSMIKNYSKSNKYIVLNAHSDSMQPEIKPKDLLIVRIAEMEEIVDNHIYIFCHDNRFYCKYLSYNVGQVIVRSANPEYPTRYIEKNELENFKLVGEVVGLSRNLK